MICLLHKILKYAFHYRFIEYHLRNPMEYPRMPQLHFSPSADTARLRSGTAARLAGLPVTTLRVWERRYAVVAAPKTATGQRLYSELDVQRLRALKQLTGCGHAIGTIAGLDLESLQALVASTPASVARPHQPVQRVVVVGGGAAQKLRAVAGCTVAAVHDDLDQAETQAAPSQAVDLLLVHLPSLQPLAVERLLALQARLQAGALIVLYAFGPDATAELLRAGGATVRRDPISGRELARLVGAAPRSVAPVASPRLATPRQYSDETLVRIAELPSAIACECLRHVAEIVLQLAGFERYSADCVSVSPADAAVHRQLSETAASARTMFEQALAGMLAEEGHALAS